MPAVLLAEADRELRYAYHWFLTRHGFDVETAADGLDCLAKLRRFVPDLVVLDLELPWGGGDGVLGVIREDTRFGPIQVLLTSAGASPEVLDKLAAPPVIKTLTKPFPLASLLPDEGAAMNRAPDSLTLEMPTPEELTELESHIQSRLNSRIRDLRLSVVDDGLVLEGLTHTYYAKQLAQHAVMEAVDLPIRANEIKVV